MPSQVNDAKASSMRNVILMTLMSVFLLMSRGAGGPVRSLYIRELGASYGMISMLGTVGSVASLASSYLWGDVSDRAARRKRYMVGGLIVMLLGELAMAIIPSYLYLFPLGIVSAISSAAFNVTSLALMGDIIESSTGRGARMGLYRGVASAGFGLVAFFAGAIADRFGLRANYMVSAGFLALAITAALAVQDVGRVEGDAEPNPETLPENPESPPAAERASSIGERRLPIWPLLISALVWTTMFGAVYSVWANYMHEELGFTQTVTTRLWSIASTSELFFMVLAGWLSDRVGRLPMLSLGFVAWTLVFMGYLAVPALPWLIGVQLLRGFAFSAYTATAMTYATEVTSRDERGRASGLYSSAGGLGSILGAMAGGSLVQWLGFRPLIAIAAALTLGTAFYVGVVAVRWRQGTRVLEQMNA